MVASRRGGVTAYKATSPNHEQTKEKNYDFEICVVAMSVKNTRGMYIVLEDWMFDLKDEKGKHITGTSLQLYGLIYGFTKHKAGCYVKGHQYAASRLRVSMKTISAAFRTLSSTGLIVEGSGVQQGSTIKRTWMAVDREASLEDSLCEDLEDEETPGHSSQKSPNFIPHEDSSSEDLSVELSSSDHMKFLPVTHEDSSREGSENALMDIHKSPSFINLKEGLNNKTPSDDGNDDEIEGHVRGLMDIAIKRTANEQQVSNAYRNAIKRGYTPELIIAGYEKYVSAYKERHPNDTWFAKRLDAFLNDADGLRFYQSPKKSKAASKKRLENCPTEQDRESAYRIAHPEYSEMAINFRTLNARLIQARLAHSQSQTTILETEISGLKEAMARYKAEHAEGVPVMSTNERPLSH